MIDAPGERRQLIHHALRSLVKGGDPTALEILGFGETAAVGMSEVTVEPKAPLIGGTVRVSATVRNTGSARAAFNVDLRIGFVKANGRTSPKVFRMRQLDLGAGESTRVSKLVSLRQQTTRRHFPGIHTVEIVVNGRTYPSGSFTIAGSKVRHLRTDGLTTSEVTALRRLMEEAFGPDEDERFREQDWQHALGGIHFVLELDGGIASHAAVVERTLHIAGRPVRTGYVEAVATMPEFQGRGLGTEVMQAAGGHIQEQFELGALGTGEQPFYERLGWEIWRGPTSVRAPSGEVPTPDEDGYIMVLRTPSSPTLDLDAPISCDWRDGDVW
jgi:aminoglycoside 2'-N-acetyltransferase I